ncbi:MAG TPA: DUF3179 domain-containing protein [Thermoanaerobaculia bacterium]|nr:DUF3179 domain-containing protein [Thermoanaerobaculia bacterium]
MRRLKVTAALGLFAALLAGAGPAGAKVSDAKLAADLEALLGSDARAFRAACARAESSRDPRYAAPLVELLRFPLGPQKAAVVEALGAIAGLAAGIGRGEPWHDGFTWLGAQKDPKLPAGFTAWKGRLLAARVDPALRRFFDPGAVSRIPIERIQWGGVKKDGIPALDRPELIAAAEATYLTPEDRVFGVEIHGDTRAYPLRILDWHEMANDVVGDTPVSLAYCTLCGAGVLYSTKAGARTFTFGSSGLLYESNKLMYDRQTETLWNQLTGEPVAGPLAGSGLRLERLPIVVTSWAKWKKNHPATKVLSPRTGFDRDYTPGKPYGPYFASPDLMFPSLGASPRMAPKTQVFALLLGGVAKAYPLAELPKPGVISDQVGGSDGVPVVLVIDETGAVRAYRREDRTFGPVLRAALGASFLADQEGHAWKLAEDGLSNPSGRRLARLPGHETYWFGWSSFYPATEVWSAKP